MFSNRAGSLKNYISVQYPKSDDSVCCLDGVRGRQMLRKLLKHVGIGEDQLPLYIGAHRAYRGRSQLSDFLVGDILPESIQPLRGRFRETSTRIMHIAYYQ